MKRAIYLLAVVSMAGVLAGCHGTCGTLRGSCARAPENAATVDAGPCENGQCQNGECQGGCDGVQQCGFFDKIKGRLHGEGCCPGCGRICGGRCGYGHGGAAGGPYPYYMVRGPRDFLAPCPPSIGP